MVCSLTSNINIHLTNPPLIYLLIQTPFLFLIRLSSKELYSILIEIDFDKLKFDQHTIHICKQINPKLIFFLVSIYFAHFLFCFTLFKIFIQSIQLYVKHFLLTFLPILKKINLKQVSIFNLKNTNY